MKKILLKVGVSLILLVLLLRMTDIAVVWERIRHVNALVIIACMSMLGSDAGRTLLTKNTELP
jgi:hypothetical protein